jgi:hypothetical protein
MVARTRSHAGRVQQDRPGTTTATVRIVQRQDKPHLVTVVIAGAVFVIVLGTGDDEWCSDERIRTHRAASTGARGYASHDGNHQARRHRTCARTVPRM